MTPSVAPRQLSVEAEAAEIVAGVSLPDAARIRAVDTASVVAISNALAAAIREFDLRPAKVAKFDRAIRNLQAELAAGEVVAAQNVRFRVPGVGPDLPTLRAEIARLEGERAEFLAGPDPREVALEIGRRLAEALVPLDAARGDVVVEIRNYVNSRIPVIGAEFAAMRALLNAIGQFTYSRGPVDPRDGSYIDPPKTGPLADLVSAAENLRMALARGDRALQALDRLAEGAP